MRQPRLEMEIKPKEQAAEGEWHARNASTSEYRALGELMYAAYKGTVDDEGETPEQSETEAQETLEGKYGPFLSRYSFVIEDDDKLASASVVTLMPSQAGPHLVFLMTREERRGQGMGTFLMKKTMNALAADGYERLTLFVSEKNVGARRLYRRLGFKETGRVSAVERVENGGER